MVNKEVFKIIQLTPNLVMIADNHCYIVGKPRLKPGKSIKVEKPRYYTTVAQAIKGALQQAMRDKVQNGETTTLRQFIEQQEMLQEEFEKLLTPLE